MRVANDMAGSWIGNVRLEDACDPKTGELRADIDLGAPIILRDERGRTLFSLGYVQPSRPARACAFPPDERLGEDLLDIRITRGEAEALYRHWYGEWLFVRMVTEYGQRGRWESWTLRYAPAKMAYFKGLIGEEAANRLEQEERGFRSEDEVIAEAVASLEKELATPLRDQEPDQAKAHAGLADDYNPFEDD